MRRLRRGLAALKLRHFALRPFRCPLCGPSLLVRLDDSAIAVRCARCGGSAISMSLASAVRELVPGLAGASVYELSARGAFFRFLVRSAGRVTGSQYVAGAEPGSLVEGVRVEDVQRLTFAAESFDVCTSTEVFEHVPDDRGGFAELCRVLKPGGVLLFTVPVDLDAATTRERARLAGGALVHLEPPIYHRDPARGDEAVLCFRDYGADIVQRLRDAGFTRARIVATAVGRWFGHGVPVIVAHK